MSRGSSGFKRMKPGINCQRPTWTLHQKEGYHRNSPERLKAKWICAHRFPAPEDARYFFRLLDTLRIIVLMLFLGIFIVRTTKTHQEKQLILLTRRFYPFPIVSLIRPALQLMPPSRQINMEIQQLILSACVNSANSSWFVVWNPRRFNYSALLSLWHFHFLSMQIGPTNSIVLCALVADGFGRV